MDKIFSARKKAGTEFNTLQSTLFDLIAAINEDVLPGEDWLVTEAVIELFETGRVQFVPAVDTNNC
jgi:hypothetical protein